MTSACNDSINGEVSNHRQLRTFWLIYGASFIEGMDMQLLPASFTALEVDVGLTPSRLAILTLCQALLQNITAPVWGILVDHGWSGKWILVCGAVAWGLLTLLLACTENYSMIIILRCLNGIALAALTPVSQSIICCLVESENRGLYFGWCGLAMMLGQVACAAWATGISHSIILGLAGWRISFIVVGVGSFIFAGVLAWAMGDHRQGTKGSISVMSELAILSNYFKKKSFVVIVVQGCFGSIPWSALNFLTMYFQYSGLSDHAAGLLMSCTLVCNGLGQALGGRIGDTLERCFPFHGRPLTAQISVFSGIPLIVLLFRVTPDSNNRIFVYASILVPFSLLASWCAVGVNRPLLTEIVPSDHQGRVISWLTALEGSVAACTGAPLVGVLAEELFGYKPRRTRLELIPENERELNRHALAVGMQWMTIIPWAACFLVFSFLHFTYRRDVEMLTSARTFSEGDEQELPEIIARTASLTKPSMEGEKRSSLIFADS